MGGVVSFFNFVEKYFIREEVRIGFRKMFNKCSLKEGIRVCRIYLGVFRCLVRGKVVLVLMVGIRFSLFVKEVILTLRKVFCCVVFVCRIA